jgi:hypothetical protein
MLAYYIPFILHCHVKAMLDSGINTPCSTYPDHRHHIDSSPIRWLAIRTHFSQHSSSDGATNWKRANMLGDLVCFRPPMSREYEILGLTCEIITFFFWQGKRCPYSQFYWRHTGQPVSKRIVCAQVTKERAVCTTNYAFGSILTILPYASIIDYSSICKYEPIWLSTRGVNSWNILHENLWCAWFLHSWSTWPWISLSWLPS